MERHRRACSHRLGSQDIAEQAVQDCSAAVVDCPFEVEAVDGYVVAADGDRVSAGSIKGRVCESDGRGASDLRQCAANYNRMSDFG